MILKALRNGLGVIIAGVSYMLPPKTITRTVEQQQKIDEQTKNIELYQFFGCPFCIKTRRTIKRLNLKITTRNASSGAGKYRTELLEHGGEIKVPCLKIITEQEVQWMYNSSDIIKYLENKFG